jgi:hypothetical protein
MSVAKTDVALCIVMVLSLILLHALGEQGFWGGLFALPPLGVPLFFAIPLCQAFSRGIASARDSIQEGTGESPTTAFRNELRPRIRIWLVLWIAYVVILECYLYKIAGGGNIIVSVPCATTALLMIASCFIWSPRCKRFWALVLLTVFTPTIAFVLAYVPASALIYIFGPRGYMDMGLATMPPLLASLFLVVAASVTLMRIKHKGDAWFQP